MHSLVLLNWPKSFAFACGQLCKIWTRRAPLKYIAIVLNSIVTSIQSKVVFFEHSNRSICNWRKPQKHVVELDFPQGTNYHTNNNPFGHGYVSGVVATCDEIFLFSWLTNCKMVYRFCSWLSQIEILCP